MEWMFARRLEEDMLRRGGGGGGRVAAVNNQGAGGQREWRQTFPSHNTLPLIHPCYQWTVHFSSHASLILSIRTELMSTCNTSTRGLHEVKVYRGHQTLVFVCVTYRRALLSALPLGIGIKQLEAETVWIKNRVKALHSTSHSTLLSTGNFTYQHARFSALK